ncbi:MAG: hypothetical protein ACRDSK_11140 [Actinophytocola sp.]|uniref:hypothetical protein n=1 Tax=Actinophytocola sp. TaxID=1872138 RepID=UPI003D6BBD27
MPNPTRRRTARAEFEARRRHGLVARQRAKLARLAEREAIEQEESEKGPLTTEPRNDEAA